MYKKLVLAVLFTAVSAPALAQNCPPLKQMAAIKLERGAGGNWLAPVSINGTPKKMVLNTGSGLTSVWPQTVTDLKLPLRKAESTRDLRDVNLTGPALPGLADTMSTVGQNGALERNEQMARVEGFTLGNLNAGQGYFLAAETPRIVAGAAGDLGTDLLARLDFDLDFVSGAVNMFDTNHCDGQVVYWKTDAIVTTPFTFDTKGRIRVPVTVDGVKLSAVLDTATIADTVNLDIASEKLKFNAGAAEALADDAVTGAKKYRGRFAKIDLAGIEFSNVSLVVMEDKEKNQKAAVTVTGSSIRKNIEDNRAPDFVLGLGLLSKLHVYVASKEKKLYISTAQ